MNNQNLYYNPTNEQRHQLLLDSLKRVDRLEDYENILELLSPPPNIYQFAPPLALKNMRIGIIGGGLAGLSSAYELRKLGANITIFDAEKSRIGGRVYTLYFDKLKKHFGEFGPMRIPVSHETTWHYINVFNLDTESLSTQSDDFLYAHNIRIRRELSSQKITELIYPYYNLSETEKNIPWNELRNYATDTMLKSLSPQVRTEILKILPNYSDEYASITKLTNRQVFEMLGLSQEAINLLAAVEPFTGALLNISHDETMSSNYTLDFLNTYRITGGMVNLPLAFYNSLINDNPPDFKLPYSFLGKVDIRLGYIVNGISKTIHSNEVNLHYNNYNDKKITESFDYVICTIPFSTLRDIKIEPYFSNQKMQTIKELNYIEAQKTLFLCKMRFWEENESYGNINGGISFTDLPIQSIVYPPDHLRCEKSEECSFTDPGVLIASYNLGLDSTRLSNQNTLRRFNIIKRNVEEVHGLPNGFLDTLIEKYVTVNWNTKHWFRGAFAANYPGQKVNFSYSMLLPEYNNKVLFAGEHVSTKQAWMQGSLQTGKSAANQIAKKVNNQ